MSRYKEPGRGMVLARSSKEHGTVFQIRWRINNGPAKYDTIGPDRKEAERALAVKLDQINRGTYVDRHDDTFHDFAHEWYQGREHRLKEATRVDYTITFELHLLPFFGNYRLSQITPELVDRYIAEKVTERKERDRLVAQRELELAEATRRGDHLRGAQRRLYEAKRAPGLSNRSINKTLTRMRQVLEVAVQRRHLDRNPVDAVDRLKVRKAVRPFLQLDQIDPLLAEIEAPAERTLVETLLLSGLRIGEALALRWSDVDLLGDPPRLTVRRSYYRRGIEGPVKTGEEGTVTFPQRLLATLLEHKERSSFAADGDLVFCTGTGRHLNPSNVRQRILAPAIEHANAKLVLDDRPLIPPVTPHGLRYTFCSLLVAQGEDIATVAAQMRHADPTTTLRVYTQVLEHTRRGAAERLEQAIWGKGVANRIAKPADALSN